MRQINVLTFVSMDGVMQGPGGPEEDASGGFNRGGWSVGYFDDAVGQEMGKEMGRPFDLLLGRRTYDIFAAYWPYQEGGEDNEIATLFNSVPKYVASRGRPDLSWAGSTQLGPDLAGAVREIRDRHEDVKVVGSLNLVQTLLREKLFDRLDLWVYPVVLGVGKTVFDGVVGNGRRIEIDMHSKGIDQGMIDVALATGMPVRVSPKFWAEHMGMPYHQADIRDQEIPKAGHQDQGLMAMSAGSRSFTRYGYADLLREDRKFSIVHRIWPGTQRLLLWGDPAQASAFGHSSHFCDAAGLELMEPLTFKGREGSGHPGGRCAYADKTLDPGIDDWKKFAPGYRLWGRHLYNPDATPEAWRRDFRGRYGKAAAAAEEALANASRIMPLLTPSGALYIGHSERVSGPTEKLLVSDGITTYRPQGGRPN